MNSTNILTVYSFTEDKVPFGFPQFTMQPQIQGVEKGRNALLPCRAEGHPTPTIRWLKSFLPVDLSDPRIQGLGTTALSVKGDIEEVSSEVDNKDDKG
ncbi:ig-like domain-containing protein [Trichonephila clavipes]|nr:ig-like domain-containing protein [Trichonephila clavipes]